MKIGIDIDDTISNTFEYGLEYAKKFTKECCHREYPNIEQRLGNIKTHRAWQEVFEWNEEEEVQFFEEYAEEFLTRARLKEDADTIIQKLYADNEIILITARSEKRKFNVEELTRRWLKENNVPFHKLYLGRKKSEVCQELGVDVFIDDSYENCKSVQELNTKVYLMNHMSNRNIEDDTVERVYSWNELYEKIKKYEEESSKKEGKDYKNGNYCSYSS